MIQNFFHKTGKPFRTARLEVETLEGRDMPSTLAAPALPTPSTVSPPPPPVVQGGLLDAGGAGSCGLGGGNIDVSHAAYDLMITRSTGEEIPQ